MRVTIQLYGRFKYLAGVERTILETGGHATMEDLLPILARRFPKLPLEAEHIGFLVNGKIAARNQVLQPDDDLAVFEIFAGG